MAADSKIDSENCVAADPKIDSENSLAADSEIGSGNHVAADSKIDHKTGSLPIQKSAAKTMSLSIQKSAAKTASLLTHKSAAKPASLPIRKSTAMESFWFYFFFFLVFTEEVSQSKTQNLSFYLQTFDSARPLVLGHPPLPSPYPEQLIPIPEQTETTWLSISSSAPASVHHKTSPPFSALWEGKSWNLLSYSKTIKSPCLKSKNSCSFSLLYAPKNNTSPQTLYESPSISIPPPISSLFDGLPSRVGTFN